MAPQPDLIQLQNLLDRIHGSSNILVVLNKIDRIIFPQT